MELAPIDARYRLADTMATGFLRFLFEHYQFLRPTPEDRTDIVASYRLLNEAAIGISTDIVTAMGASVRRHHERLRTITIGRLETAGALDEVMQGAGPICRQYSASLQCRILGLDAVELDGPLLDVGCGEAATLVRHLRGCGHDAWGINRMVAEGAFTSRGDWFRVPEMPEGWQTIVSHLAFSLHFMHADVHSATQARRHAVAYMDILMKLRPGGSFVYAPGLPFIESWLDSRHFDVRTRPIMLPGGAAMSSSSRVTRKQ